MNTRLTLRNVESVRISTGRPRNSVVERYGKCERFHKTYDGLEQDPYGHRNKGGLPLVVMVMYDRRLLSAMDQLSEGINRKWT
jgi:hypothetical protein